LRAIGRRVIAAKGRSYRKKYGLAGFECIRVQVVA